MQGLSLYLCTKDNSNTPMFVSLYLCTKDNSNTPMFGDSTLQVEGMKTKPMCEQAYINGGRSSSLESSLTAIVCKPLNELVNTACKTARTMVTGFL